MPRTAKVFMTNRSQAARLPKEFQPPRDWKSHLGSAPVASEAFMADVDDLPVRERDLQRHASCWTRTGSYIMKRSHPLVLKRPAIGFGG